MFAFVCGFLFSLENPVLPIFSPSDLNWMDCTSGDFPGGSVVMSLPVKAGDMDFIPELGRSPGTGNGNPPQDSQLGNSINRGA